MLRWKTLYSQLEKALDACEDVADELEIITVKHTQAVYRTQRPTIRHVCWTS